MNASLSWWVPSLMGTARSQTWKNSVSWGKLFCPGGACSPPGRSNSRPSHDKAVSLTCTSGHKGPGILKAVAT